MKKSLYIGGKWRDTGKYLDVIFPFNGEKVGSVAVAGDKEVEDAIKLANEGFKETKELEPFEKTNILKFIVNELKNRFEEFSQTLVLENGKTIKEARGEMTRCINTYETAIGEAERVYGEAYDLGVTEAAKGRFGVIKKFPVGVVAGITPFNFPMNLLAHKIAPAIATGCPIIIKPASATPLSTLMLAEIIEKSGYPKKAFSVLPCDRIVGQKLVEDDRISLLSFTGSPSVGWKMKSQAGKKKVVLELGGNAGLIVEPDVADIDYAVNRTVFGAYYQAGQSCISVQRIFVHSDIYEEFKNKLVEKISKLKIGDPRDENTDIGGIIDKKNRDRLQDWIDEALEAGATCTIGNKGEGTVLYPTLLENVKENSKVNTEEAFGAIAVLNKYDSFDEVIEKINDSKFGLQVGIFSNSVDKVWRLFKEADVGGVIHNDVPSFRVDNMPYGGVKDSGFGREGIKYAMRDMLEDKILVLNS